VHGNVARELRALGRLVTSTVTVGGAVHVGSRHDLIWGIGSPGRGTPDGEVTGLGVDGASLPVLDAHGGHGDWRGDVRCWRGASARWGRGGVPGKVVIVCWGSGAVAWLTIRGRGKGAGSGGLGLLLPLDANRKRTRRKAF
jgi:hypothetical protein